MKRIIGMTIVALALATTGCSSMGQKKECGCGAPTAHEGHDANGKDGCKDGKCGMHGKSAEEKKPDSK